jgi:phasin
MADWLDIVELAGPDQRGDDGPTALRAGRRKSALLAKAKTYGAAHKNVAMHYNCRNVSLLNERDGFCDGRPPKRMETMAETSEKTAEIIENVEFPTFDAFKATDQFRAVAEKGVEQSKEAYAKFASGTETTHKALQSSFETAKTVGNELSLKTIAALRANAEAGFSHLEALVAVKSPTEFIELQTAFLRKQIEKTVEQAKDFQVMTTKAAEDVSKPIKDVYEKAMKDLKVA